MFYGQSTITVISGRERENLCVCVGGVRARAYIYIYIFQGNFRLKPEHSVKAAYILPIWRESTTLLSSVVRPVL